MLPKDEHSGVEALYRASVARIAREGKGIIGL